MILLFLTFTLFMLALLYTQTKQGPLDACFWLLLRLRAAWILVRLTLHHLSWWCPAHWRQAMADAREEPMAVEIGPPENAWRNVVLQLQDGSEATNETYEERFIRHSKEGEVS
jgi:hypothetical protein